MALFLHFHILVEKNMKCEGQKMENYRMNCSCGSGSMTAVRQDRKQRMPVKCPWEHPIDHLPMAMGYVPVQKFGQTYDLRTGLQLGTIFPELHKPFCGKGGAGCI